MKEDNMSTKSEKKNKDIKISARKTINVDSISSTKHINRSEDRPICLEELRLSQNYLDFVDVEEEAVTIPVRKPSYQEFIRVHPDDDFKLGTYVLEIKIDGAIYLVDRSLWDDIQHELKTKILYFAINNQGAHFLWPINCYEYGSWFDTWSRSAHQAAKLAEEKWIRVVPDRKSKKYIVRVAENKMPEPKWPKLSFKEVIELAFKDLYINDLEHPALKKLRGDLI